MREDQVTKNLLMFCYHCEHAYQCDTEEACRNCWMDETFTAQQDQGELTTEQLLREYAL